MKKQTLKQNSSLKKWIRLSSSYNRSTNLELDFKDSSRLKKIYLSLKFQTGLKEVLNSILEKNSSHRVRVLSGSPGLGKSTFALLVAYMVSKKDSKRVNELMKSSTESLNRLYNSFQTAKNKKLLPVFINGYEGDIEQVFKNKLKIALTKHGLVSKNAIDSSGKMDSKSALDFYKNSLSLLKTKNYNGIFVIYDEFGKYLEKGLHNPTDLNIQFLQNFAEFCDRSGEKQCHLMLITHLSVSQYASQLPINVQQEWAKIEGRFQESAFYDKNADYYKMISTVFEKNISQTQPILAKKHKNYIKKYLKNFTESGFEGFIDLKNISSILLNCFPLHPSTLALLPHLSKKVAQNERTLYTFLTRDENYSLKRFLDEEFKNENPLLMPYHLYQYFKLLIGKDIGIGGTYKIQLMAEEAFQKLEKTDNISKQIISLMALCSVIKDTYFAPLTKTFIASCFNQMFSTEEVKKCLKLLKDKKIIFYNKNSKQYLLQEGSPIDIDEEISKLKNTTLSSKSLVQVVKRYFKTHFITPKKYNFDNAINRFYRTKIISVEELKSLKSQNPVDFYKEDGLLFYVVPFSHDELIYAKSEIKNLALPLTVFLLPQQFIECRRDIEELNAVDCLYNNKEILSASPLVKKELDRHKEILLASIKSLLNPLIGYMSLKADIIYPKSLLKNAKEIDFKPIFHFKELQRYLGDLFEKEYNKYVSFNLEYINRHSVSGSITLARKKFTDVLREEVEKNSVSVYVEGKGPDYMILDTMLRLSHFKYNSLTKTYQVSQKSKYYIFLKEYEKILIQHPQGLTGKALLDLLISPPYGLRLGVIPVFLALADLCFKQPVSHYLDTAYVKELDGDHYDLLMKYPKKTAIHYVPISTKQQKFLSELSKLFKAKDQSIRSVIEALLKWRASIPESTKLSSKLSLFGKKLLIQIDSSKEPDALLFNKIPEAFDKTSFKLKIKNQEIEKVLTQLKKTKKEIEGIYKNLLLQIKEDLTEFILFINKQCLGYSVKSKKNKMIETFQEVLLQVKDYPFSLNTSRFVGRALNFDSSNYDQYFLETMADVLTGSSPRHWDSKGYFKFEFALKSVKTEIELASEIANPNFKGQSVLAFIDKGQQKKRFIKLGTLSGIDKPLEALVKKIKNLLNSFDDIDKRKIILALLESVDKKPIQTVISDQTIDSTQSIMSAVASRQKKTWNPNNRRNDKTRVKTINLNKSTLNTGIKPINKPVLKDEYNPEPEINV